MVGKANRAILAFGSGDFAGAADDFSAALSIEETADLRTNRAIIYESLGRYEDALVDYDRAGDEPDADLDTIEAGRQRCLAALSPQHCA